jgi:predicted nucleic-acid-binding protein
VSLEEPAEVAQALDWMAEGMDFADALHLARSGHCSAFITFDRKLAKSAKGIGAIPVEAP